MGSSAIAALIAHLVFWVLLAVGPNELGVKGCVVFAALWLAGLFGLPYAPYGAALFAPYVAMLDVTLVLLVFKGDVRLG